MALNLSHQASIMLGICCLTGLLVLSHANPLRAGQPSAQPPSEQVHGIDVSFYQGKIQWDQVKQDGVGFAYAKATGGLTRVDPEFVNNWHGMREAGILRGAYHFFYAAEDATAQAKHFVGTVKTLRPHDLPPMLDVEITDHAPKAAIIKGVLMWLQVVEQELGRRPIIYSDLSFANEYLTDAKLANYPLWIAEYGVTEPTIPQTWQGKPWLIWQHSSHGKVKGINGNVDLDVWNGSPDSLFSSSADASSPTFAANLTVLSAKPTQSILLDTKTNKVWRVTWDHFPKLTWTYGGQFGGFGKQLVNHK